MKSILLSLSAAMLAFPLMVQAAGQSDHDSHRDHGAVVPPLAQASAQHDHGTGAHSSIELNAGKKWGTDAPLRKGMESIRALTAKALPAAHAGKLTPAGYDALAKDINSQIAFIVKNCKLDPKADAQLHFIIGDLANGVDAMEGKRPNQVRAAGVVELSQALNTYGDYFNHPGWQTIKLPSH